MIMCTKRTTDWCSEADHKKLTAMGYEIGQDGAVNRTLMGKQKWAFIWAPHYFSDVWLEQHGYRRGFLADCGVSDAELRAGYGMVFDDPISAAIWLEVNAIVG